MSTVTEKVTALVQPILQVHGFYLVDLNYVKEGTNWYLRVFIDKPGGIDIEECALVNQELSDKLDAADPDPIPNAYFLEVSSPGAERPIKTEADLRLAVDQFICVSLYQKVDGQKVYEGYLDRFDSQDIYLTYRAKNQTKQVALPRNKIAAMRLAIEF